MEPLQPFLALCKSASSPRAAAEIVTRVTSSPNTFIFAELLDAPQIQALADSAEFASYLTLLQIFSYGTFSDYKSTANLPALNDAQTLKLRQLSLLTLARWKDNLTYAALAQQLGLHDAREVEATVISAIYADLISATLDPTHQSVLVSSVAPLRDLAPGSVQALLQALSLWSSRCEGTLEELQKQMEDLVHRAGLRAAEASHQDALVEQALEAEKIDILSSSNAGKKSAILPSSGRHPPRFGKRGSNLMMGSTLDAADDEAMDVDDVDEGIEGKKRASRRKL